MVQDDDVIALNQGHKHDKRKNTRDPAMSVDNTDTAAHVVATLKSTFSLHVIKNIQVTSLKPLLKKLKPHSIRLNEVSNAKII